MKTNPPKAGTATEHSAGISSVTREKVQESATEQAAINSRSAHDASKSKLAQAEVRTQQAEARTEEANTRTKQAEARTEQAIRASELSYRRLFEAARDGILILDVATGRISDVNPFLVELLGFSHGEMVGKTVGELSPFKDIESNKAMLERLQQHGYVRYEALPLETTDRSEICRETIWRVPTPAQSSEFEGTASGWPMSSASFVDKADRV